MPSLELGISTTVIGMGIVFLVLVLLSFITWLLAKIVDGSVERKQARQAAKAAAQAPQTPSAPVAVEPTPQAAAGISAKTVAAIAAAISAASGIPVSGLHFTAIRRTGGAPGSWANSGTADIIGSRQTYL